jgi:YidC/Oxa1 family membrane protein insertase
MELWTYWLNAIQSLLTFFSSHLGLGTGFSIVVLTLLLRTVILPISWPIAYRGSIRQKKMLRLQPELARLKLEHGDEPPIYAERVMKLYQENGMRMMDWRSVLGSLMQMPLLFLGCIRRFEPA